MTSPSDPARTAQPLAVLMSGAPASGKSTVGALLAHKLNAALLDLDTATASLTAVLGTLYGNDDLDDPAFSRLTRAARYETIFALAVDNLSAGTSVVLVAPFTRERRDPTAWAEVQFRLQQVGAIPRLVWLRIPADTVIRRMEERAAARDNAKLQSDWSVNLDLEPPAAPHIEADALSPPVRIADRLAALLLSQGSHAHTANEI